MANAAQQTFAGVPGYVPVDEEVLMQAAAPAGGRRLFQRGAAAALCVGAALCGAKAAAGSLGASSPAANMRQPSLRNIQMKDETLTWVQGGKFDSHAPLMDIDVEYQVDGGWGTNYDHIPTPEMCAAMCWGVPKCKAYTWVKDAGLDGCPSQCWLKSAVGKKVPKKGLVSGVPPARAELGEVPEVPESKTGSMYCYSLMVPGGYEEGLLQWQHKQKASIFGCEGFGVYSNKPVEIADGVTAHVVNSTLKCGYGGDSSSALNSWIFIAVWQKVIDVGEYTKHDWVVKVDPDAVFFPDRAARLLVKHEGAAYLNNCHYGMHGPIEVFSSDAIDLLAKDYGASWDGKAPKTCVEKLHFSQWGEDMFIDQCLRKVLKADPVPLEPKLMCESHCDCPNWYWCNEGSDMVSYHPFKSIDSYKNCMATALGSGLPAITAE